MCVFKYHAFIYFLRPPPWYGTITFHEDNIMTFFLGVFIFIIFFQWSCSLCSVLYLERTNVGWSHACLDMSVLCQCHACVSIMHVSVSCIWQCLACVNVMHVEIIAHLAGVMHVAGVVHVSVWWICRCHAGVNAMHVSVSYMCDFHACVTVMNVSMPYMCQCYACIGDIHV
jgi:hypothetical protein